MLFTGIVAWLLAYAGYPKLFNGARWIWSVNLVFDNAAIAQNRALIRSRAAYRQRQPSRDSDRLPNAPHETGD